MDSHDSSNSGANSGPSPEFVCTQPESCASKGKGKSTSSSSRKNMKWSRHEHTFFIRCCEEAIAAGHREGKCFTTTGWELIIRWLKERTGRDWPQSALINHWKAMRKDHTLLFELLNCTGVTYDHSRNAIVAPDHWWESKIRIRKAYKKFRNMDCKEIYDVYSRLFGDTYNSDKHALTPTKMARKGGFLSSVYGVAGPSNDTIPVTAEMSDESDEGNVNEKGSAMDFSQPRSGDKRKGSTSEGKQKSRKSAKDTLSESAHMLATLGEDIRAERARARARARDLCPTCAECVTELKAAGLLEPKTRLSRFVLNFLTVKSNRDGYAACAAVDEKWDWLVYNFEEYCASKK